MSRTLCFSPLMFTAGRAETGNSVRDEKGADVGQCAGHEDRAYSTLILKVILLYRCWSCN